MNGRLFVISAPSGTGKTTVIERLLSSMPGLSLSVSVTTRAPRSGERDGRDYRFISKEEFLKMRDGGELLEWALVHGTYYGTPKAPIEEWIRNGKDVILDIDVQGAGSVKKLFKDAVLIFLLPPSREELVKRLTSRGTNKGDDLNLRIANADKELAKKGMYEHNVVNDTLDDAVKMIEDIIGRRN